MCLDTITKRYKKPTGKVRFAYKVLMVSSDGSLHFPCQHGDPEFGSWMERVPDTPGFHTFKTAQGARKWSLFELNGAGTDRVVKVKIKGLLEEGTVSNQVAYLSTHLFVARPARKVAR